LTDGRRLRGLIFATTATMAIALALVFFYAPLDSDQGFVQKILYIHVPMAIVSLCGFVAGALLAVAHLRTGDRQWDLRSYVAIHMSLIFGIAALIMGSIWARASWGHWWVWDDPTLVSFLIVLLLFATYQPLRFSIEDSERQARYASVFAIVAGAFVPLNFPFLVALIGVALLFVTLYQFELSAKRARMELRALRRGLLGDDAVRPLSRSAAPS
jgi:heme exporter protein C